MGLGTDCITVHSNMCTVPTSTKACCRGAKEEQARAHPPLSAHAAASKHPATAQPAWQIEKSDPAQLTGTTESAPAAGLAHRGWGLAGRVLSCYPQVQLRSPNISLGLLQTEAQQLALRLHCGFGSTGLCGCGAAVLHAPPGWWGRDFLPINHGLGQLFLCHGCESKNNSLEPFVCNELQQPTKTLPVIRNVLLLQSYAGRISPNNPAL